MVSLLFMGCLVDPVSQIKPPKIKYPVQQTTHSEATYWVLCAHLHQQNGDWDSAEKALKEAQVYHPNDPWLYATWGDIAWRAEQKTIAIAHWEKAIQLFGMNEKAKKIELQGKIHQQ